MSISGFLRVSWFIKSVISFTVTQHQQWLCEPSRGYIIKTLSFEPQCCLFLREDDLKFRWATLFMRHQSKLTFHRITIVIWEELLTSAPPLGSVFRFKKKSWPMTGEFSQSHGSSPRSYWLFHTACWSGWNPDSMVDIPTLLCEQANNRRRM